MLWLFESGLHFSSVSKCILGNKKSMNIMNIRPVSGDTLTPSVSTHSHGERGDEFALNGFKNNQL